MFDDFNVNGLYIVNQNVLSLYSVGKYIGVVLNSGEGVTHSVPIFDGYSLQHAINRLDVGGKDLTKYLMNSLDLSKTNAIKKEKIAQDIKEKACYIALNYEDEINNVEPYYYPLPDDKYIEVKEQRINCPEILFKPDIVFKQGFGIGDCCHRSIQACDIDIRKDLYNCIVLSGGSTMYNGLKERLTKEMKALASESFKEEVNVIASPNRKFAAWTGGSILSNIFTFNPQWITKAEYMEYGPNIVHRKCF
jgi:actin-related protein